MDRLQGRNVNPIRQRAAQKIASEPAACKFDWGASSNVNEPQPVKDFILHDPKRFDPALQEKLQKDWSASDCSNFARRNPRDVPSISKFYAIRLQMSIIY